MKWIPAGVYPFGFPLPAFAGTSFAGMTKGAGMTNTVISHLWTVD